MGRWTSYHAIPAEGGCGARTHLEGCTNEEMGGTVVSGAHAHLVGWTNGEVEDEWTARAPVEIDDRRVYMARVRTWRDVRTRK